MGTIGVFDEPRTLFDTVPSTTAEPMRFVCEVSAQQTHTIQPSCITTRMARIDSASTSSGVAMNPLVDLPSNVWARILSHGDVLTIVRVAHLNHTMHERLLSTPNCQCARPSALLPLCKRATPVTAIWAHLRTIATPTLMDWRQMSMFVDMGSVVGVHCLLQAGATASRDQRINALVRASGGECRVLVAYLLCDGRFPPEGRGFASPIGVAQFWGRWDTIHVLLGDERTNAELVDIHSAIEHAVRTRSCDLLRSLVRHPQFNLPRKGLSALEYACLNGYGLASDVFFDALRGRNHPAFSDIEHGSVWEDACRLGNVHTVRMLLRDRHVKADDVAVPGLYAACAKGFASVVECILDDDRVWTSTHAVHLCIQRAKQNGHHTIAALIEARRPWRHWLYAHTPSLLNAFV